jgi:hypothetical protein
MGSGVASWRRTWVSGLAAVLLGACGSGSQAGSGSDGGVAVADGGFALDGGGAPDGGALPDGGAVANDGGGPAPDGGGVAPDGGVAADGGSAPDGGGADGGSTDGGSATPVVRFAAMGDTGKGNSGQYQVAAAVQAKCAASGCDFVLLLGDNIYDSGVSSPDDPQFQTKFEQPYANINLPFYVILGNHDYGGNGAGYEFSKGPYEVEYSSRSTKWRMPATYYRFREQHVEFFALDTNSQMYNRADDQRADVPRWIAASTATWKIALGHHPYLSNGTHGNAGEYDGVPFIPIANGAGVKDFFEAVVCGKVDLYLCGHDHSRQWLTPTCNGTELVVSGAGASTTDLPGSNASRFQASTLGFLYVRIEGRTLTAEFVNAAGEVEFTRALAK